MGKSKAKTEGSGSGSGSSGGGGGGGGGKADACCSLPNTKLAIIVLIILIYFYSLALTIWSIVLIPELVDDLIDPGFWNTFAKVLFYTMAVLTIVTLTYYSYVGFKATSQESHALLCEFTIFLVVLIIVHLLQTCIFYPVCLGLILDATLLVLLHCCFMGQLKKTGTDGTV